MSEQPEIPLSAEERKLLDLLAGRQRESEKDHALRIETLVKRAELGQKLWGAVCALIVAIVIGTCFVQGIQNRLDQCVTRTGKLEEIVEKFRDQIAQIRSDLRDKADRK